ncbi:DUF2934 domain-containing protein [Methylobacterium frigidaeris]|uniref:DUF2934 domain-containing protein n=1 Tax=Methylobacterium frigidaeris TaxID=2038277 RepID=A0AA37H985_9HYPH|nr:DUF2934 domain-containing protein [Methylobacterium frigidaeris]PIK69004.1 hypothetical protein CS379_32055 [Methylobacterium frigidaeris]GJD61707.1 hypothetical protein MPEAHAMD_1851 [Methylobacterium frigidaeris]
MREIPLAAIRARAYDIWERNHRPDGYEIQFWLLAERELRAELDSRRDTAADDQVERPLEVPAENPAKSSSAETVEG